MPAGAALARKFPMATQSIILAASNLSLSRRNHEHAAIRTADARAGRASCRARGAHADRAVRGRRRPVFAAVAVLGPVAGRLVEATRDAAGDGRPRRVCARAQSAGMDLGAVQRREDQSVRRPPGAAHGAAPAGRYAAAGRRQRRDHADSRRAGARARACIADSWRLAAGRDRPAAASCGRARDRRLRSRAQARLRCADLSPQRPRRRCRGRVRVQRRSRAPDARAGRARSGDDLVHRDLEDIHYQRNPRQCACGAGMAGALAGRRRRAWRALHRDHRQ